VTADGRMPVRVLIAKAGLDGHDRGAIVIARALREAGMEVAYTGIRKTPAQIAEAAEVAGAEVVGVSILSGAHLTLLPSIVEELAQRGITAEDVVLMAGGIIPPEDVPFLKELGFRGIFGPGTDTREIVDFVLREVHREPRVDQ
jgi:methylmalonyl-CoA mutase, C-terminal domain